MPQSPIQFDRVTGDMRGGTPWECTTGFALLAGSRVGAPERDINIMLNPDAIFSFPYGDGYWSKLLNRTFKYEEEL